MAHPDSTTCDERLLNRYLEGAMDADERLQLRHHLTHCPSCRRQAVVMTDFTRRFRERVEHAADSVDFVACEKEVLNRALRPHHSRSPFSTFAASLKYVVPAVATVCLVLFLIFSRMEEGPKQTEPLPSAIIHSFKGSIASVMILETPETRQTILWYDDDIGMESEQDAL